MPHKNQNNNTNSTVVLGIDPGTNITGYALIKKSGSKFVALDFGCIRPPKKYDFRHKHLVIFQSVELLIKKYSPIACAFESQYVGVNPQSVLKLGMAKCAAMLPALQSGIDVAEYTPSQAKKAVSGRGGASKKQVQHMVKDILCLPEIPQPEDAADAISIAICHLNQQSSMLIKGS